MDYLVIFLFALYVGGILTLSEIEESCLKDGIYDSHFIKFECKIIPKEN